MASWIAGIQRPEPRQMQEEYPTMGGRCSSPRARRAAASVRPTPRGFRQIHPRKRSMMKMKIVMGSPGASRLRAGAGRAREKSDG